MNVKLQKIKKLSDADITLFEKKIGFELPFSFRNFLLKFNGAEPETNIFNIESANDSGVNGFIPLNEILKEAKNLDCIDKTILPIAWAEGGNYVVLDTRDGIVYFWDHEVPSEEHKLANDIDLFLNNLKPFDPESIELKEGQVESAWIDPNFLKNL
ncbi:SMI1/KNR4 family protein [Thalassomonas viridans]|uniref:SMI1/KNR4 family protein n=1 Tax=Thalassomonas viridans TaxID=137584 RepID=A0AAE9Z927_9GAMM|nr:SMI1/KNR4 family protein [Thalassomonas viridans]WDE09010.1 SMI1/KNR4 family protein [Thalassomonas viridans]